MKLKIAFQMDPIADVDINGDTSFRLAEEGQKGVIRYTILILKT